jgi:hypothetical protein
MREQRKRKALYVNRREELYAEPLLRKEYASNEKPPPSRRRRRRAVARRRSAS